MLALAARQEAFSSFRSFGSVWQLDQLGRPMPGPSSAGRRASRLNWLSPGKNEWHGSSPCHRRNADAELLLVELDPVPEVHSFKRVHDHSRCGARSG